MMYPNNGGLNAFEQVSSGEKFDLAQAVVAGSIGAVTGAFGGSAIGLPGMVAGTVAISTAVTFAAKSTEVGILQVKKSRQDGDSTGEVINDVVNSIFNNGGEIIGFAPLTKAAGYASGALTESFANTVKTTFDMTRLDAGFLPSVNQAVKAGLYESGGGFAYRFGKGFKTSMSMPTSKFGYAISYGFAAYEAGNTVYSAFSNNPIQRAKDRGYRLS